MPKQYMNFTRDQNPIINKTQHQYSFSKTQIMQENYLK